MERWMKECLQLGRSKGFLTYAEASERMPDEEVDPERVDEFLLLLEDADIELRDQPPRRNARRRTKQAEVLYHKFEPEVLKGWKSYPIRVRGPQPSSCHGAPALLVQSMTNGFVTANCSECGKKHLLSRGDFLSLFLWVSCPRCKAHMVPDMLSQIKGGSRLAANYGYYCDLCHVYILLADLLPHWEDVV